ncbi:MAG: aldo/keto reductase [Prevotella sp.]|nr:aldo/keto reductase [Prevotella sp.]
MKLNNDIEIPQIGVGTWTLRGETARQNVRLALEAGFRHIDTAQGYENETEVGLGIADSDVKRQDIFLTTKVATNIMRESQQAVRPIGTRSACCLIWLASAERRSTVPSS